MSNGKRYTPSVSLREDQRNWLMEQAEKKGISYTHYIRKVALGELRQAEKPFRKQDQKIESNSEVRLSDLGKVLEHDLPKIGNNLNQLARHANKESNIGAKQIKLLKDIRKEISQIADVILKALR